MNTLSTFHLAGKTALVTGGAGRYGRQVVEGLAEAGAQVFMASRNLDTLELQAGKFKEVGHDVGVLQYDQSDEKSILRLLDEMVSRAGAVDILVNNAVAVPMAGWDSPASEFTESMQVNATGLFLMIRCFGDHMSRRGTGAIINIGSIFGMMGPDNDLYEGTDREAKPDYFFHKGGLLQLTRFAAARLGPAGVRVNTISAGGLFNNQDPRFVARFERRTLLGRMANNTDLKGTIVFLASDASAYITGANIVVDGGYTAK